MTNYLSEPAGSFFGTFLETKYELSRLNIAGFWVLCGIANPYAGHMVIAVTGKNGTT